MFIPKKNQNLISYCHYIIFIEMMFYHIINILDLLIF